MFNIPLVTFRLLKKNFKLCSSKIILQGNYVIKCAHHKGDSLLFGSFKGEGVELPDFQPLEPSISTKIFVLCPKSSPGTSHIISSKGEKFALITRNFLSGSLAVVFKA